MIKYLFLLAFLLFSATLFAQTASVLKISGEVTTPLALTLKEINQMPHSQAILKDKNGKPRVFSGVPVTDILARAGATLGGKLRGKYLSQYLLVKCADGYNVLFSMAELDSSFTNRVILLADSVGGKPLPEARGPLRMIVPGEKKPARSCFKVTEMIIAYGK